MGTSKMSKSKGNVVSPIEMSERFGTDAYRYFLLRDVPFGLDGSFCEEAIIKRFNSDLANDLGNLVYRTLTMIEKYFHGMIPEEKAGPKAHLAKEIEIKIDHLTLAINSHLGATGDFNFSAALEAIWELINLANKYIEDTKPWNLAKVNKTEELKRFILVLVGVIRNVERAVSPFMPQTATSIQEQLGEKEIKKGNPLFPRIET
jgi:methionyl-tRNA synthetase